MNKKKTLTILKSVAIVLIIVFFAFLLRANAYNLSIIPENQKDIFIDSNGLPYFSEMDSYYNLRLTQNYVNNGHFGDTIKDGVPWDMHRYSPDGLPVEYEPMIVYVTSFLYYLANMFSEMSLKEVAFWTGAIIAPLAAIPAYIFVRRITNDYGGITAALLASLAPSYFGHTFAGFFDTDMFQVTLPIFIVLFFIESIRSDKLLYRIIFALLSLVCIFLFSLSWVGYIFTVAVLIIFVIVYLIAGFLLKMNLIEPIKDYSNKLSWVINQKEIFSILLIAIVGFVVVTITGNLGNTVDSIIGLAGATQIQAAAHAITEYPNVGISIGELQLMNLLYGGLDGAFLSGPGGVINGIGGIVSFFGILTILFIFAQRLWNLQSIRTDNRKGKAHKSERKALSKLSDEKNGKSFMDSTLGSLNTLDQINKSKRETLLYLTLFIVWMGLSALAITQGSRFVLQLVIPASLATGIFVGYAVMYIKNKVDKDTTLMVISLIGAFLIAYPIRATVYSDYWILSFLIFVIFAAIAIYGTKNISSNFNIKKTAVMMIITLAIVAPTVAGAYQSSVQTVPGTSDPMWNSMTWIQENTSKDTVVTSWWDFGYLFTIAANRQVTFDGGTQTSYRIFWVGKAMTTTDTELSAKIFTMLATSGDITFLALDNYTNNSGKSVEILEKTLTLPKEEAKTIMTNEYKLTSPQADEILNYSHPANPRPVIFVASSDMVQKAYWWTYFGNWDFESKTSKAYTYLMSNTPAEMKNISGGRQQAIITNHETNIGNVPVLYQTILTKGSGDNGTINASFVARFVNGSEIKLPNGTVFKPMFNDEEVKISKLFIVEDGMLTKNETVDKDGNYALFIFGDGGVYTSILMSKELEYSMFTKLYILGGFGQDSYEFVHSEPGVSLWRVK
ncbi:MAG: dolichyl-diphosphooligosaccharide--protein glycosyltransferase subunit STT3 [Methanobacteriaceae archaeon]|jgi:dolichyl-diphosphooligosaccharide--protein glycosyltransferase|nr:dolichyl-diphosphooligosaccharide--protein glycosyltransferase subunit STT3 [Candidatus Methanorudis spinitermitis]